MLSRIIYRIVSVLFLFASIASWLTGIVCTAGQLFEFHPVLIPMAIWGYVLGFLLSGASNDAWRAGRYDPLYD
jgi:hypothetical protein